MSERRLLPLLTNRHGSRSFLTCQYKCANACDHPEPNQSGNEHVSSFLRKAVSRRSMVKGSAAGAALTMLPSVASAATGGAGEISPAPAAAPGGLVGGFRPVEGNTRDQVVVPEGFTWELVAKWGDPVVAGAAAFDPYRQTAQKQAEQFGYNCDYVGLVYTGADTAIMSVNHEYTDPEIMFPTNIYTDAEKIKIEMAAHGMSIIDVKRAAGNRGRWVRVSPSRATHNRRITAHTPMQFTGPASGHPLLRTTDAPKGRLVNGMLNNCSGGTTPWGTTLSGEENFNQYFDASGDRDPDQVEAYDRYGITGTDSRGWSQVEDRFDLTKEPNEPNRFGWVVEIDPRNPRARPRKHTMLGRFKHEGATVHVTEDGRVVVYMGDDEKGDYIYKFASKRHFDPGGTAAARRHNLTLLTEGTLYVAKLVDEDPGDPEYDGVGRWIPLATSEQSLVPGMSLAEVLVHTRLAADKVGATRMDRPEDIERNPVNGKVYAALTNNSNRGSKYPTDEANPLGTSMVRESLDGPLVQTSGNRNGYVLEWTENNERSDCRGFRWDLFLVCGDPEAQETYFGGYDKSRVSPISCPDNVTFDPSGRLWISTDGNQLGSNDGMFAVPVSGSERGHVKQFLTVPVGAETCGPLISRDGRTVFVAVQHPGEVTGATFEDPASTWPHVGDYPRPAVVCAFRNA